MQRSKIPMLSRFDSISHIMPYFGQTHRAFLLLSGLCSDTRRKLDEFYDEFVTLMKEKWIFSELNLSITKSRFSLPNDLFETSYTLWDKADIKALIKFIEDLRDSKGWYFNSHFMHSKIKIRDPIVVDINCIKELYAYIDVLKSIRVILCEENIHSSEIQYESSTFDTNWNHALLFLKWLIHLKFNPLE